MPTVDVLSALGDRVSRSARDQQPVTAAIAQVLSAPILQRTTDGAAILTDNDWTRFARQQVLARFGRYAQTDWYEAVDLDQLLALGALRVRLSHGAKSRRVLVSTLFGAHFDRHLVLVALNQPTPIDNEVGCRPISSDSLQRFVQVVRILARAKQVERDIGRAVEEQLALRFDTLTDDQLDEFADLFFS